MQRSPKGPLILSLLIITVGVGWLLTAQGVAPGIDWVWTLGLAVIGIAVFIVSGGLDKASVIAGPFFMVSSVLSVLRQSGQLRTDVEVPLLVILVGALMLLAQTRFIPPPKWLAPNPGDEPETRIANRR